MFIQTEATADPAKLRFLPGREVLAEGTLELSDRSEAAISPLAERLFAIPGVAGVSLGRDSITVARTGGEWQHLKPAILGAIMEHFLSGAPTLRRQAAAAASDPAAASDRFRDALRQVIDPELGYNIVDLGLIYDVAVEDDGAVRVTMTTTTPGCPATNYLKAGAGEAVSALPGVQLVSVDLTYEPRWTPEMMAPEAKAHFGIP
jgi:metal-sulfur cluster biosynthetic enzyme